ncbi:MAG: hypothetical protein AAF675_00005 [Pseudomonadota bacterium]
MAVWSESHALRIAVPARIAWTAETGCGLRNIVEAAEALLKQILRGRLTARSFGAQMEKIRVAIAVATRAIRVAKPAMVRLR